ncbi:MAG TPA: DUF4160 domain-containing protein [Sulfurovum sp.]|nr:DUF4160 domain-containing protein [Sulfurovum sp.]
MPTVHSEDGFRFFFFSDEHTPEHIHIEKADAYARVELDTLKVTNKYKLNSKELKKLVNIVQENQDKFQGAWHEYFKQ